MDLPGLMSHTCDDSGLRSATGQGLRVSRWFLDLIPGAWRSAVFVSGQGQLTGKYTRKISHRERVTAIVVGCMLLNDDKKKRRFVIIRVAFDTSQAFSYIVT